MRKRDKGIEDHRLSARERLVLALLAVFAIGCMIAAVVITSQVIARLGSYGTAADDNLQWTISQIEVDKLRFMLALENLDAAKPEARAAVRRRFDLLYSRATTLGRAPAYRDMLAQAEVAAEVAQVIASLDAMMPAIDGDDAGLVAARDALAAQAARMTPPIRRIASAALAIDARRSDAERNRLTTQIVTLSGLSGLMFVALFLLLVLMWRLYRGRLAAETAIAAARDDALAAEQARARFLGMTSHEMRTPLNGLLGALELLEDSNLDAGQRDHVRLMRISGEALRGHIDEALDRLDPHSGTAPVLRPVPFDLDAVLADLVAGQTIAARARGNALRLEPRQVPLGRVTGDARRLGQVLLNFLGNAIKFTRDGTITVSAWRGDGDEVVLAVRDTGIGIAPAAQSAIFEDFTRLADRADPPGEDAGGSGLGLGIARRIVTAMGGRIEVESRPGAGSTFTVRVPLPAAQADGADAPETGPGTGTGPCPAPLPRRLCVLLVEDIPASRTVTTAMLERDGHKVVPAADGIEGVRAAAGAVFDLILMDVDMPRLDGVAATRRIREGGGPNAATRIVALTAWNGKTTAARLRDAGADAVEVKPLSRAALRALLAEGARDGALLDADHLAQMRAVLPTARLTCTMAGLGREAAALLASLESAPPHDLAGTIHRLAGTAGTCGASALHARLGRIGAALEAGQDAQAAALCDGLGALWRRTRAALRARGYAP